MEYDQSSRSIAKPVAVFAMGILLMLPAIQVGAGGGIVKPVDVVPVVRSQGGTRVAAVRADAPARGGAWTRIQQKDSQCGVPESRAMRQDMSRPKGGAAIAVSARNPAATVARQEAVWQRLAPCSPRLNQDRQKLLVLLAVWRGLA